MMIEQSTGQDCRAAGPCQAARESESNEKLERGAGIRVIPTRERYGRSGSGGPGAVTRMVWCANRCCLSVQVRRMRSKLLETESFYINESQ